MGSPLHLVVSHASVALLCGLIVARRQGRTLLLVGSTLSVRDTRTEAARVLSSTELARFDDAYRWDELSRVERGLPIFVPPKLAHPIMPAEPGSGLPLSSELTAAEALV